MGDETATNERVNVSVVVDAEMREQLGELARAEDRSVSAVIRRALAHELERDEAEEATS